MRPSNQKASTKSLEESLPFHKKNGVIHWKKCAEFYGAKSGVVSRRWYKAMAPILDPPKMRKWLQDAENERLRKIAEGNTRYRSKEPEIIRLYSEEKLGAKAISKLLSGSPTAAGVRTILIRAGVYHVGKRKEPEHQHHADRQEKLLRQQAERRHQVAVCLWALRHRIAVEATCKENGWNKAAVWNHLSQRPSYKSLKRSQKRRWIDKRVYGHFYSRRFLRESQFQSVIEKVLLDVGQNFIPQARLPGSRTKVDLKCDDGTFLELKVAMNSGQTYEFIGQAMHYKKFAKRIILCVPDDVEMRCDLYDLIVELGVAVCNQVTLIDVLRGPTGYAKFEQTVQPAASSFRCKCCGSIEKRRHRQNSYCLECAPQIKGMRFDSSLDRWVSH